MKTSKSFLVTVVALLVVGLFLLHRWNELADEPVFQVDPKVSGMRYVLGPQRYRQWLRGKVTAGFNSAPQSNAALMALLPQFSDCAKQLNLPVPTANQVALFVPPLGDMMQAALWLTNGYLFRYYNGAVSGFESPDDFYAQQDFVGMERFAGKDKMTTNEAIDLARNSFVKLGYKPADFHMDEPPNELERPIDGTKFGHIPFCRVVWRNAEGEPNALKDYSLQFDVDMQKKRLVGMHLLLGKAFWPPVTNIAELTNSLPISLSPVK